MVSEKNEKGVFYVVCAVKLGLENKIRIFKGYFEVVFFVWSLSQIFTSQSIKST